MPTRSRNPHAVPPMTPAMADDDRRPDGETGRTSPAVMTALVPTTEKSIDINLPISTVYNQWTQFQVFAKFMGGVESVTQLDDNHLRWVAEIGGTRNEWDAEIFDQQPDRRIAWRAIGGVPSRTSVSFEPLGGCRTKVILELEVEADGVKAKIGQKLGFVSRKAAGDLRRFKDFIEARGMETGGWRGQI